MNFTGNEGQFVTLEEASHWTATFRESPNFDGVHAHFYGINKIKDLLKQTGCVGLRIYRAIDDTNAPVLVLVGTDGEGNDLTNGLILEKGTACPPMCGGGGNPLQG